MPSVVRRWQQQYDTAVSLLSAGQLGVAVDLDRERPEILARYGGSVFGRSLLAARRLVEAGVPLITVNWYDDSFHDKVSPHWDQHNHIFASLQDRMLPILIERWRHFWGIWVSGVCCRRRWWRRPGVAERPESASSLRMR